MLPLSWHREREQPQRVDISVERRFDRRHFRRSGVRRNSDQALE